jgi:hypothetical protein
MASNSSTATAITAVAQQSEEATYDTKWGKIVILDHMNYHASKPLVVPSLSVQGLGTSSRAAKQHQQI